jgi:ketosteroid isomerase-like protein
MSKQNVEIVQRIYEALAHRDTDTLLDATDPEIRLYSRPSHPEPTVFCGHAGLLKCIEDDMAIFEGFRFEARAFVELGDYVMVPMRQTGRGRASGIPVGDDLVTVWKFRGGKAVEWRIYSTEHEALDDLGVAEQLGDG